MAERFLRAFARNGRTNIWLRTKATSGTRFVVQQFELHCPAGSLIVVLHSDGLMSRWDLARGIRHPALIAAVLYRDFARGGPYLLAVKRSSSPQVFPNAACVVSLVDRLMHRAEVISMEGELYRLKEDA